MKARTWTSLVGMMLSTLIFSCGIGDVPDSSNQSSSTGGDGGVKMTALKGAAQFGSQCPAYGYSTPPHTVPTELWDCPVNVPKVELAEDLQPFMLQADCKKMTIDVRNPSQTSLKATTWNLMPDGNFFFTVDGGFAKLKDDGAGHMNCATPLVAKLWGKVDCTDRDKPVISVETVWWVGTAFESDPTLAEPGSLHHLRFEPILEMHAVASSLASVSTGPSSSPSPIPSPLPSAEPEPTVLPSASPSQVPSIPTAPVVTPAPACRVPASCYFHALTKIHQCS